MTAKERKPFRIACRRWKNCCNCLQIQKTEKLHLSGVNHFEDIVETITSIERSILNLKISNHRLMSFDLDVFWQWVYQVVQLELVNCMILDSFLEGILTCSEKLTHLTLQNMFIFSKFNRNNEIYDDYFGKFFSKLNKRNTVATSVKYLVIHCEERLDLNDLSSLITVFPNVVQLEMSFPHFDSCSLPIDVQPDPGIDVEFCEKLIKHMATILLQLETLIMRFYWLPADCKCEKFLHEVKFSRLKTFKFHNNMSKNAYSETEVYIPRVYSITNSHSRDLTAVEFLDHAKTEDIIDVLKNHTGLRVVNMKLTSANFFGFTEFYEALANSKLVDIKIYIQFKPEWIESLHQMLDDTSLPVNSTVRGLVITSEHEEDIFISIFLKCFSALSRLNVKLINTNFNLTNIFNQANLKCLHLRSKQLLNLATDRHKLQLSSLKNLEYLKIETGILRKLLAQQPSIFFSNLRHLYIASPGSGHKLDEQLPLTQEELRCLPLYNLEAVFMSVRGQTTGIFTLFSKPLDFPKIQYIGIHVRSARSADLIPHCQNWFQSWFEFCPCLNTVFLRYRNTGICLCRDPMKGQIREFKTVNEPSWETLTSRLTSIPLLFRYYKKMNSWYTIWLDTTT